MPPKKRTTRPAARRPSAKSPAQRKTPAARTAAARRGRAKPASKRASRAGSPVAGRLGLVTLHVDDFASALSFYRDTLGFPVGDVMDIPGTVQWAEFRVGDALTLGVHADPERREPGARPPGGASGFYFTVRDVDAAVAELRRRGVKVVDEPEDKPYGRDAAFMDPDGNVIAIVTPK